MKCEDMRKTVEKKVKRWRAGAIVIIMAGIICGGIHSQIYAGEFGGFDIDIGGDGGTFDDWTEEPEAPQEPAKPEQSPMEAAAQAALKQIITIAQAVLEQIIIATQVVLEQIIIVA